MYFYSSRLFLDNSEKSFHYISSFGTYKSCNPEYFTFSQRKRNIFYRFSSLSRKVFHFQYDFSRLICLFRKSVRQIPTYHKIYNLVGIQIFHFLCSNPFTVPKYRYFITYFGYFFHFMRNIDYPYTVSLQFSYNPEQVFHFIFRKGRSRFIQNQHFGIIGNSFRYFQHLHLGNRKSAYFCSRIYIYIQFCKYFLCILVHFIFIYK